MNIIQRDGNNLNRSTKNLFIFYTKLCSILKNLYVKKFELKLSINLIKIGNNCLQIIFVYVRCFFLLSIKSIIEFKHIPLSSVKFTYSVMGAHSFLV